MEDLIARLEKVPLIQRVLGLVGIVLLIVLLCYFFFISDYQKQIALKEAQIKTLEAQIVKANNQSKHLNRVQIEVDRLEQRRNEALTLLPNDAEIPELLQKIAALVEQSDCTMSTFAPQAEQRSDFYARIPVKMSIEGNYHSIAVFFDKVSKLSRIVNVNNISLSNPKVNNKKVELKADFMATTYKFVQNDQVAKPTSGTGFSRKN